MHYSSHNVRYDAPHPDKKGTCLGASGWKGQYLEITPKGSKLWRMKYRIHGKEKRLSLGIQFIENFRRS